MACDGGARRDSLQARGRVVAARSRPLRLHLGFDDAALCEKPTDRVVDSAPGHAGDLHDIGSGDFFARSDELEELLPGALTG